MQRRSVRLNRHLRSPQHVARCWRRFGGAVLLALALGPGATIAAEVVHVLDQWLAAQAKVKTWSADFVQTRTLKALTRPLETPGRVWVALPDRFRWELGEPAQTVAVRRGFELMIAYPRLKRVERYALGGDQPRPWKDALALLEAGFPRSRAELEERFRVVSIAQTNTAFVVALQPRAAATRRFLTRINVSLATNDFALRATEVVFPDGSTMRNDYREARINPPVDDALFQPPVEPDFKIVEPAHE